MATVDSKISFFRPGQLEILIAVAALVAIGTHVLIRFIGHASTTDSLLSVDNVPLTVVLATGGLVLAYGLFRKLIRREFGSDLLAGISIVVSAPR